MAAPVLTRGVGFGGRCWFAAGGSQAAIGKGAPVCLGREVVQGPWKAGIRPHGAALVRGNATPIYRSARSRGGNHGKRSPMKTAYLEVLEPRRLLATLAVNIN